MPKHARGKRPRKKEKDEREWTTLAQKAHLKSKQDEYILAREAKNMRGWFSVELEQYFGLFPTEPITVKESIQHPSWSHKDKRASEEEVSGSRLDENDDGHLPLTCSHTSQRVKTWFKNHYRPSKKNPEQKDEFKLELLSKRRSNVQHFSKLYHNHYYKKLAESKWRETYLVYYGRVIGHSSHSTATDAKEVKQVSDAIRKDLRARLLDIAVVVPWGEVDEREDGDEDQASLPVGEDLEASINLPETPIWFRNAVSRDLWEKASLHQKDAVEDKKKEEEEKAGGDFNGEVDETEEDDHKVKRLRAVLEFVTSQIW